MGTKNNPCAYDCYANAHPDEPMFVLLGRDKHAPTLVWLWALLRELDQEDPNKVAEARDCVEDMLKWQVARGRQTVGIGHAALAGVMGPDEDLAKPVMEPVKLTVCESCAVERSLPVAVLSEFKNEAEEQHG